jgi:hypothetical protein
MKLQSASSSLFLDDALFVIESKLQLKQLNDGNNIFIGTHVKGCISSMIISASSICIDLTIKSILLDFQSRTLPFPD